VSAGVALDCRLFAHDRQFVCISRDLT
jgi:hypothetical protein